MPDAYGNPTADELRQHFEAQNRQAQQALQEHGREVNSIIELGQSVYGAANFDAASQIVAEALGNRKDEFMATICQYDDPASIVVHLADNPARLKQLAALPTARMLVELARVEAQHKPNGHAHTMSSPEWKARASNKTLSDADWNSPLQDALTDKEFNRQFEARMKARAGRRG